MPRDAPVMRTARDIERRSLRRAGPPRWRARTPAPWLAERQRDAGDRPPALAEHDGVAAGSRAARRPAGGPERQPAGAVAARPGEHAAAADEARVEPALRAAYPALDADRAAPAARDRAGDDGVARVRRPR